LTACGEHCVLSGGSVRVEDSILSECGEHGVFSGNSFGRLIVADSVVSGGDNGVFGLNTVILKNSEIHDSGAQALGGINVKAVDSTISGATRDGIRLWFFSERSSVRLVRTEVSGIARNGVLTNQEEDRVTLKDSSVTGSGFDADCGATETCADLATYAPPVLLGSSTCDTSYDLDSGFPGTNWGVCASD
jgi:hypothetical protein